MTTMLLLMMMTMMRGIMMLVIVIVMVIVVVVVMMIIIRNIIMGGSFLLAVFLVKSSVDLVVKTMDGVLFQVTFRGVSQQKSVAKTWSQSNNFLRLTVEDSNIKVCIYGIYILMYKCLSCKD